MEMERVYSSVDNYYYNRPAEHQDGDEDGKRKQQSKAQNYKRRCFMLSAVCFGLLCVSLVASALVLQIQIKAERDMKSSDKNMLKEFNETVDVTGQLQNDCITERELKLSYMNIVKEFNRTINNMQNSYSRLTTEKDQLQNDCRTERELKLRYMNKVDELTKTKDNLQVSYNQVTLEKSQFQNDFGTERELKVRYMNKVDELTKTKDNLQVSYSRLTTEKDQLQKRFNSMEAELKKRNLERGYHVSNDKKNWTDSRQVCRDRGGDLAVINSVEEQRFLSSLVKENVWIGLSDIDTEGLMNWVDNSRPNVLFWHPGEPNNVHGAEDCVELESFFPPDKNWNDQVCSIERRWICEN